LLAETWVTCIWDVTASGSGQNTDYPNWDFVVVVVRLLNL